MAEMQGNRWNIAVSRSRFYRKNDNAHVEQKNGSVVRELFGELRLDSLDLEDDLRRLESEWSDYCNFFRPTKMIVAKIKKPDGKGYVRKYQEGGPRTPYQRVRSRGTQKTVREHERNPALPAGRPQAEAHLQTAGELERAAAAIPEVVP